MFLLRKYTCHLYSIIVLLIQRDFEQNLVSFMITCLFKFNSLSFLMANVLYECWYILSAQFLKIKINGFFVNLILYAYDYLHVRSFCILIKSLVVTNDIFSGNKIINHETNSIFSFFWEHYE